MNATSAAATGVGTVAEDPVVASRLRVAVRVAASCSLAVHSPVVALFVTLYDPVATRWHRGKPNGIEKGIARVEDGLASAGGVDLDNGTSTAGGSRISDVDHLGRTRVCGGHGDPNRVDELSPGTPTANNFLCLPATRGLEHRAEPTEGIGVHDVDGPAPAYRHGRGTAEHRLTCEYRLRSIRCDAEHSPEPV
jgi:hypothetical protein